MPISAAQGRGSEMASARTLKRKAQAAMSSLCLAISTSPNGDIDLFLPGWRKPILLTSAEVSLIRAVLGRPDLLPTVSR